MNRQIDDLQRRWGRDAGGDGFHQDLRILPDGNLSVAIQDRQLFAGDLVHAKRVDTDAGVAFLGGVEACVDGDPAQDQRAGAENLARTGPEIEPLKQDALDAHAFEPGLVALIADPARDHAG